MATHPANAVANNICLGVTFREVQGSTPLLACDGRSFPLRCDPHVCYSVAFDVITKTTQDLYRGSRVVALHPASP